MSDDRFNNDAMFLVVALYAQQAYADAQYNNKVNAYISRGYTIEQANRIVRTWYLAYRPPHWSVVGWRATLIGWILFIVVAYATADYSSGFPGSFPLQAFVIIGVTCGLQQRITDCVSANERSAHDSTQAQAWLEANGL